MRKVLVIGAGASGMMAAYAAKMHGASVVMLEKNQIAGRKINATGNGRCNFTNSDAMSISHYHSKNTEAVKCVLEQFPLDSILEHFDSLGVMPHLEENGKYFPMSGQASSVSELFEKKLVQLGVDIEYGISVERIICDKNGVKVIANGRNFTADHIIIATGGMAAQDTGSDGIGFELAKTLGHSIVPILPVIVQMKTKNGFYKSLNGVRIYASASLVCGGNVIRKETGDVMFYDYGLSGPPIFQLSCNAAPLLASGKRLFVELDLLPSVDSESLNKYISRVYKNSQNTVCEMLGGIINRKLIDMLLGEAKIPSDTAACSLSQNDIDRICTVLKHFSVEVTDTKGWENAQSTYGGVALDEVDAHTLISKKNEKISFCGEVLDVAGDCGGYNLTWAWSSGYVSGKHAALK